MNIVNYLEARINILEEIILELIEVDISTSTAPGTTRHRELNKVPHHLQELRYELQRQRIKGMGSKSDHNLAMNKPDNQ